MNENIILSSKQDFLLRDFNNIQSSLCFFTMNNTESRFYPEAFEPKGINIFSFHMNKTSVLRKTTL